MRRLAVCGALVALLLMPAEALSARQTYKGTADADPATPITIKVKTERRKRYVTAARAKNLLLACSEGRARLSEAEIVGRVRVRQREFAISASDGAVTVAVTGQLARRTIKGTFRYHGLTSVDGDPQDCDSGKVPYTVKR